MVQNNTIKRNIFELDTHWINEVQINLSAVERRTISLTKRRTVKKDFQVAWLLKAITMLDLTTLSGDDTFGKVDRLCQKALNPLSEIILRNLKLPLIVDSALFDTIYLLYQKYHLHLMLLNQAK